MKILLPFIFSAVLPGTGQFYLRDYLKGIILLLFPFVIDFLIPDLPFQYPYLFAVIISLTDIYLKTEKKEGRQKAMKNLIFGLIVVIVILPSVFYLFTLSMYKGGQYVSNEILNVEHTEDEMTEISKALDNYYFNNGMYPGDFQKFVRRKPVWSHWITDSWDNKYRYQRLDSGSYKLTSAGKDEQFDTDDDIKRTIE